MPDKDFEQTLILIKPDALKNSLTGYVLSLLSEFHTGLRFAGSKVVHVSRMLAEEHYVEHKGKPFFGAVVDYIMGASHYPDQPQRRRVIAIVYKGPDAVKKIRDIVGPTNPHVARDQRPGCIRALGTVVDVKNESGKIVGQRMDNLVHASDSDKTAEREIKLWFTPKDIPPFMRAYPTSRSEGYYYFKEGRLSKTHEPGSVCLLTPGELAWQSDLVALKLILGGNATSCSLEAIAAKYLLNDVEND